MDSLFAGRKEAEKMNIAHPAVRFRTPSPEVTQSYG